MINTDKILKVEKPKRPALRYFGGKWRIAPWIISHFPKHTLYVEPFAGSASVLLQKDKSYIEVFNDLDGDVVNFFSVLRTNTKELIRQIELTPFSREELNLSYLPTDDSIERARRLFVKCWQSYGSTLNRRAGWTMEKGSCSWKTRVAGWNETNQLMVIAKRFKQVQIENDDAIKVINRWDTKETLFYIDPPYVKLTRSAGYRKEAYKCDVPDEYHIEMAEVLSKIKGMAIISGYDSELYEKIFKGWKKFSIQNRTTNTTTIKTEIIWLSPRCFGQGTQQHIFQ